MTFDPQEWGSERGEGGDEADEGWDQAPPDWDHHPIRGSKGICRAVHAVQRHHVPEAVHGMACVSVM